jgi:hypothetical protein
MKCNEYQKHLLGEVSAEDFAAHEQSCNDCREARAFDEIIDREAREIPAPTSAPGLWTRIAHRLEEEERKSGRLSLVDWFYPRRRLAWSFAAVSVLIIGIISLMFLRPDGTGPQPRNLLTAEALTRVEALEAEYEQAIADLETVALPVAAEANTELALRYRYRLETIDAQIDRCKTALAQDGANAHVRRYLMAAYQDKKETLVALSSLAGE